MYLKISLKIVNPRDKAGNAEELLMMRSLWEAQWIRAASVLTVVGSNPNQVNVSSFTFDLFLQRYELTCHEHLAGFSVR